MSWGEQQHTKEAPWKEIWLLGKRPWCWEGLKAGGDGDDRGWDGGMASPTRGTWWVWASSGRAGDGQGGLVCCGPWGCKESDTTELLFCKRAICYIFISQLSLIMRATFLHSPKKQVCGIGVSHFAIKFSSVTEGETLAYSSSRFHRQKAPWTRWDPPMSSEPQLSAGKAFPPSSQWKELIHGCSPW